MLTLIAMIAGKVLPAGLNAVFQNWVITKQAKNTPEMVANQQAKNVQADDDRFMDLEARAARGDKAAQEEIRKRFS